MCFLIFGRNIICNIATVVVVVVIYFALQLCAYLQPNVGFICLLLLCYWLFCFNFLFEKKKKKMKTELINVAFCFQQYSSWK